MKILESVILILVYNAQAEVVNKDCKGIIIHNIIYEKEILRKVQNSPYQLAIDYDKETLFFSFSNVQGSKRLASAFLNLKTGEYDIIKGINGGFANAVDSKANTVYIGGCDGIYKYNYETKQAMHVDGTTGSIWQLFYKNNLYYTTYPDEALYVFKDGKSERVPELKDTRVLLASIDNNDNIYFSNLTGLYVYKKAKNYISFLGVNSPKNYVNGFTSDPNGKLYFSTPSAIYSIKDINNEIELLSSMSDVYGIAIERDGSIIISDYGNIFRLKPTKDQCKIENSLSGTK